MIDLYGNSININDILNSSVDPTTGSAIVQLGRATTGEVYSDSNELWGIPNIISLPTPVQSDKSDAAQALSIERGDNDQIIAVRDVRFQTLVGLCKPGELRAGAMGADGKAQARLLMLQDGSISLITTTDNTSAGHTMGIAIAPGKITISTGTCSFILDDSGGGSITLTAGAAALTLTGAGMANLMGQIVNIQGSLANVAGSTATFIGQNCPITCIGQAAQPIPTNTALYGTTGLTALPSPTVFLSLT